MVPELVIFKVMVPVFVITLLSFGTFFLPCVRFGARVMIPLGCILSVAIIYNDESNEINRMSYTKAFLIVCGIFVGGVLVEFFFASSEYHRLANQGLIRVQDYRAHDDEVTAISFLRTDTRAQFGFPLIFLVFTIIYCLLLEFELV